MSLSFFFSFPLFYKRQNRWKLSNWGGLSIWNFTRVCFSIIKVLAIVVLCNLMPCQKKTRNYLYVNLKSLTKYRWCFNKMLNFLVRSMEVIAFLRNGDVGFTYSELLLSLKSAIVYEKLVNLSIQIYFNYNVDFFFVYVAQILVIYVHAFYMTIITTKQFTLYIILQIYLAYTKFKIKCEPRCWYNIFLYYS